MFAFMSEPSSGAKLTPVSYISLSGAVLANRLLFNQAKLSPMNSTDCLVCLPKTSLSFLNIMGHDKRQRAPCIRDLIEDFRVSTAVRKVILMLCNTLCLFFLCILSVGARPKFTKRNSMDSVELWKYSSDKVIYRSHFTPERENQGPYTHLSPKSDRSSSNNMFFCCRMVRTKTWKVYPRDPRVSCRSQAREKAILTVSHQMKGCGWTLP